MNTFIREPQKWMRENVRRDGKYFVFLCWNKQTWTERACASSLTMTNRKIQKDHACHTHTLTHPHRAIFLKLSFARWTWSCRVKRGCQDPVCQRDAFLHLPAGLRYNCQQISHDESQQGGRILVFLSSSWSNARSCETSQLCCWTDFTSKDGPEAQKLHYEAFKDEVMLVCWIMSLLLRAINP